MKTDHWFYSLFQSAPDLITLLLPAAGAPSQAEVSVPSLGPDAPGDLLYRFEAPEVKAVNHRLDGVLWPRQGDGGTAERPVVLLEVQMQSDQGFQHRLAAQTFRFLQQHPEVEHVAMVVLTPHNRLRLGPARPPQPLALFLQQVHTLSLEELGQQPDLDPLLNLLTLPVRPEAELGTSTQQILERRPDLLSAVLPMLVERFPQLTREEIMVIAGIPSKELRHTRAAQQWIECYRFEAPELKAVNHRLDGVLWPRQGMEARLSGRWCCWRCRCRATRAFSTAWRPRPFAFCNSTQRWSMWRWWCSRPTTACGLAQRGLPSHWRCFCSRCTPSAWKSSASSQTSIRC